MRVRTSRSWWWLSGVVVGTLGLATSYFVAGLLSVRESPAVAVAEGVIGLTPGSIARWAIDTFGTRDKAVLLIGMFAILRSPSPRSAGWPRPLVVHRRSATSALAVVAGIAVVAKPGFTADQRRAGRRRLRDLADRAGGDGRAGCAAGSWSRRPTTRRPTRPTADAGSSWPPVPSLVSRCCRHSSARSPATPGTRSRRTGVWCGSTRPPSRSCRAARRSASTASGRGRPRPTTST